MTLKPFAATLILSGMALVPSAVADQWNKKTYMQVDEPIQVPGKVLQPGRYVMKLMQSQSNNHVVQIFNEREDEVQTTILAKPNHRLQPTGKTEFQWWETPAGQPRAMRAWFYPGDNFGQEFSYRPTEVAPTPPVNLTYERRPAPAPPPQIAQVTPPPAPEPPVPQIIEKEVEIAQVMPAEEGTRYRSLPHTATPIPIVGMAGLLALGASLVARAINRA